MTDKEIIEKLGGTCSVAALCRVSPQAVTQWKRKGIPVARRMFLEAKYPWLVAASTKDAAA